MAFGIGVSYYSISGRGRGATISKWIAELQSRSDPNAADDLKL